MNIIFKTIPKEDEGQLRKLITDVMNSLEREDFFIPYDEQEIQELFNEDIALLLGAYDGNKLVAMAQLYIDPKMLIEVKTILGIEDKLVCELGGNMVLPEYRGNNLMYKMQSILYEKSKSMGFEYITSMAHPDNIASCKSIQKTGLIFYKTENISNEYLRNIYIKKFD